MKPDGSEYYECVLLYTEKALAMSEIGEYVLREHIENYFEMTEESIRPTKIYFGGRLCTVELENGVKA